MYLRFMFLLTTRRAAWLRLARSEETWKTAETLILRHQLAVLQRQPRRPNLNWADRVLLATLLAAIPKRPPPRAAATGHPGRDPALASQHRPPSPGRKVHRRHRLEEWQDRAPPTPVAAASSNHPGQSRSSTTHQTTRMGPNVTNGDHLRKRRLRPLGLQPLISSGLVLLNRTDRPGARNDVP